MTKMGGLMEPLLNIAAKQAVEQATAESEKIKYDGTRGDEYFGNSG